MNNKIKKLCLAGILIALAVVCSTFYIPIGASKCFPIQHAVNVLAGVFLGPWYGTGMAFVTSLLRNFMGTGSLLAFPGSMIGAFLCGILYQKTKKLWTAFVGEAFGTGILGGFACYPVATLLMSKEAAIFGYVLPFLLSSAMGAFLSVLFIFALSKARILNKMEHSLHT